MAAVTYRYYVDLDTGKMTRNLGSKQQIEEIVWKARDATSIGFQFYRGTTGAAELLEASSALTFQINEKNDYGGTALASITSGNFTAATTTVTEGQSDTDFYRGDLDLSGATISTALGDAKPEIEAMGELSIDIGAATKIFTTLTFDVVIENDVIRGTE